MATEKIHIHRNRIGNNLYVFLLFLPALVFIIVLTLILVGLNLGRASTPPEPSVMGGDSLELDNFDQSDRK